MPEEVRDLIVRHIDSVTQLETLLFLHARSNEQWDAASVAKRLFAPLPDMAAALATLAVDGFLVSERGQYRYAGRHDRDTAVDALAEAYAHHLIPITNLVHSKARHIRTSSDTFKLRKD